MTDPLKGRNQQTKPRSRHAIRQRRDKAIADNARDAKMSFNARLLAIRKGKND